MAALHDLNILPESVAPRLGRFRDCFFHSPWFPGPDVFGTLSAPNLIFATSLTRRLQIISTLNPSENSTSPLRTMPPERQQDPDWVWRCHPNHRSPPGNGNADINNPINNISCASVTYPASHAPHRCFSALCLPYPL